MVNDFQQQSLAAISEAHELNEISSPLGYTVDTAPRGEATATDQQTNKGFVVCRIDQPRESGETFATAEEVREHLTALAALPRYCLELQDNPRITVDFDSTRVTVTDTQTRGTFKAVAPESATRLCVHADHPPAIGNWHLATS